MPTAACVVGDCIPYPRARIILVIIIAFFVVTLVALGCEPLVALGGTAAVVAAVNRLRV